MGGDGRRDPSTASAWTYGLDPRIVERYPSSAWKEAFSQIATVSLVTPQGNLTHPGYGIYTYPNGQGKQWERFASFEWIASRGGEGIQANAGVRIRGGFSRSPRTLKHSFRLFFRRKYGAGKLQFPLFGGEGADRFDKVDLRTSQNYSWARRSDRFYGTHNTLVRDVFCRDTQRDMGLPYTRSRYFHLFLNGQYWGIYMTQERPEAAFGATYFGADRDDYDTIKTSNYSGGYTLEATDGDTKAWRELWTEARRLSGDPDDARYARLTGLDESLSEPSGKPALVDIDNLISYMLIIFYSGNTDAPLSQFMGNRRSNNWYAVRNRNGWDGFRFFIHDAEHTLGTPDSSKDRTGPFHSHNQDVFEFSNPQWLHQGSILPSPLPPPLRPAGAQAPDRGGGPDHRSQRRPLPGPGREHRQGHHRPFGPLGGRLAAGPGRALHPGGLGPAHRVDRRPCDHRPGA